MSVQPETHLQQRVQKFIEKRGGYCFKNHGSMISEPGIADITCCYQGLYLAIECKIGDNKPSPQQGVHARAVWKAGGIACAVWSVEEVEKVLSIIEKNLRFSVRAKSDRNGQIILLQGNCVEYSREQIKKDLLSANIDLCTDY